MQNLTALSVKQEHWFANQRPQLYLHEELHVRFTFGGIVASALCKKIHVVGDWWIFKSCSKTFFVIFAVNGPSVNERFRRTLQASYNKNLFSYTVLRLMQASSEMQAYILSHVYGGVDFHIATNGLSTSLTTLYVNNSFFLLWLLHLECMYRCVVKNKFNSIQFN